MKIDILGTQYTLTFVDAAKDQRMVGDGYCDTSTKELVVDKMNDESPTKKQDIESYKRGVVRHEIVHAYLHESGLDVNCEWVTEAMVDWIALQMPKLIKTMQEVEAL